MKNKFWFVWNPAGRAPTYKHESKTSAMNEAKRLALLNPGQSFVVLEALGRYKKIEARWTGFDSQESNDVVPF